MYMDQASGEQGRGTIEGRKWGMSFVFFSRVFWGRIPVNCGSPVSVGKAFYLWLAAHKLRPDSCLYVSGSFVSLLRYSFKYILRYAMIDALYKST